MALSRTLAGGALGGREAKSGGEVGRGRHDFDLRSPAASLARLDHRRPEDNSPMSAADRLPGELPRQADPSPGLAPCHLQGLAESGASSVYSEAYPFSPRERILLAGQKGLTLGSLQSYFGTASRGRGFTTQMLGC